MKHAQTPGWRQRAGYSSRTGLGIRPRAGFTLAEVVIASFILLVGVLAVVGFLGGLIRSNIFTRGTAAATLYGQQVVERVLTSEYQDMPSGQDRVDGYDRRWTVVSSNGMKSVVVTVTWANLDGRSHSLVVRSGVAP